MTSKNLVKFVVCTSMVFSQAALAGTVMTNNAATTTSGSGLGDAALVRNNEIPQAATPQLTATQGLQQNGQQAANKQNAGQMAALASAAFSAALAAATCSQTPPPSTCPMAIMGALAGLAMAAMMKGAKDKSNKQVSGVTIGGTATPESEAQLNRETAETKRKLAAAAKAAGASIDTDKGTARLADGRSLNLNDMMSPSSMSSAGLKPGEIKAFGDIMKEAGKKGDVAMKAQDGEPNAGMEGGGGGVTAVYGSSGGGGGGDTARRAPASVSGAVRDFNGTPIGVSVDSIWTMMNRRYAHEVDSKKLNN